MDYNRFFSTIQILVDDHNKIYVGDDLCIKNTNVYGNPEEQCKRIINLGHQPSGSALNCSDYQCGLFGCTYGDRIQDHQRSGIAGFIAHCDKIYGTGITLYSNDVNSRLIPFYSLNILLFCTLFLFYFKK
ncbi:unnamed protein product [Cunninghamella blakesleeana]